MADEKKKVAAPAKSAKAEGTLFALAFDAARERAFVGGSAGRIDVVDLKADPWEVRKFATLGGYIAGLALVGDALVAASYHGGLRWFDATADASNDATPRPTREVRGAHRGWIRDLITFADGSRLATVADDMLVKLWDAADGRLVAELAGHAGETPQGYVSALYAVAATADGRFVASGDRIGDVRVWDVAARREAARFQCAGLYTFDAEKRDRSIGGVRRVRFSPDGRLLAAAGIGQVTNVDGFVGPCRVEVWDWQAGRRIALLEDDHKAVLNDVLWTSDGRRLIASGGGDGGGVLVVWPVEAPTAESVKPSFKAKFTGHAQRLTWHEADRCVLAAGFEGVQLWDRLSDAM